MENILENLIVFLPFIPVFFTLYGFITKSRVFFLIGYTIFAFFIIVSEYLFYCLENDFMHVIISILFLIQLIVSYPTILRFDGSRVFKSFILKSCVLFFFTNTVGIFVVYNNPLINNFGILFHSFFIVAAIIYYFIILSNSILLYDSDRNYTFRDTQ